MNDHMGGKDDKKIKYIYKSMYQVTVIVLQERIFSQNFYLRVDKYTNCYFNYTMHALHIIEENRDKTRKIYRDETYGA